MKLFVVLLSSVLLSTFGNAEKANYTGYKVVEVVPETMEDFDRLLELETSGELQFWTHPSSLGESVQILFENHAWSRIVSEFSATGISFSVSVEDVQKLIDETQQKILERKLKYRGTSFDFFNFHPYEEIVEFVQQLPEDIPVFSSSVVGTTFEGRDIVMGQISTGSDPNKPVIILECGIHAREWVAPASCLWMMNELATQYEVDPEVTKFVDRFDFLVIPLLNPDGYQFAWDSDRLWRKNRVINADSSCVGVDINRNFDANFGGSGSDNDTCSEYFHGEYAFSENESQAVLRVLQNFRSRVKAFVSIHTHAQKWMSPFGYTTTVPEEYDEMYRVMEIGVAALESVHGTLCKFGDEASVLYLTSGTTRDYAYVGEGIVYSFTIEERKRSYGAVAPPEEILPTTEEVWAGIKAMINAIM